MMARLRNRRGVFVILFGLLFMVLMAASAMAVDMSRIWTMRNELQTAAESGALAGAVQLVSPHDPLRAIDTASVFIGLNRSMYGTITVDAVQLGYWDDLLQTFTKDGTPINAVHTQVSQSTNKLIMRAFGLAAPTVVARATAWADAPVDTDNCIRPWSIPYVLLMAKVNGKRLRLGETLTPGDNDSVSAANLTRDFTTRDREVLNSMTELERTFRLKLGARDANSPGPADVDPVPGATMPGSFQAVRLPRYKDRFGNIDPDWTANSGGADDYRKDIAGVNCHQLEIGDVLLTQGGDLIGPTLQGVTRQGQEDDYVCYSLLSDGTCKNEDGSTGVDVKSAFHLCTSGCNGMSEVSVRMLGSFTLTNVKPMGGSPTQEFPPGSITGIFKPIGGTGPVGTGPTTLNRIILVRCEFRKEAPGGASTACRY
jgi:Flp pilus assembly protein TadG